MTAPDAPNWEKLITKAATSGPFTVKPGTKVPAWGATQKQRDWVRTIVTELKEVHPAIEANVLELIGREDLGSSDVSKLIDAFWTNDRDGKVYPLRAKKRSYVNYRHKVMEWGAPS